MSKWTNYRDHLVALAVEQYRTDRDNGYDLDPHDMAHEWADSSEAVIYTHRFMELCAEGDEDLTKYMDDIEIPLNVSGWDMFLYLQQMTVYYALNDYLCGALDKAAYEYYNELAEAR